MNTQTTERWQVALYNSAKEKANGDIEAVLIGDGRKYAEGLGYTYLRQGYWIEIFSPEHELMLELSPE